MEAEINPVSFIQYLHGVVSGVSLRFFLDHWHCKQADGYRLCTEGFEMYTDLAFLEKVGLDAYIFKK
jgi:hypothetical protein